MVDISASYTIIPASGVVICKGVPLTLTPEHGSETNSIVWNGGEGKLAFADPAKAPRAIKGATDFKKWVQPWHTLWQAEYERLTQASAMTPAKALKQKQAEIMTAYESAFTPIEKVYPKAEREAWAVQEAEATAFLADPAARTPVLSALVALRARGESVPDLAAKVLANAGAWRSLYAFLTGQQQRMYGEASALAEQKDITPDDILSYPVRYQLPEGL